MSFSNIKALTFDVGGTILNWHDTIGGQLSETGRSREVEVDWENFANNWRMKAAMLVIDSKTADIPGQSMEGANRHTLNLVLEEYGITDFSDADKEAICRAWHRIPAWPDVKEGMPRLAKNFIVSTLTILSTELIVKTAKRAGFHWDAVISCEMFEYYKFHPSPYRKAASLLGCSPDEVMMVAAHYHDLQAAAAVGMRTAFLDRPKEYGKDTKMSAMSAGYGVCEADIVVNSLDELADALEKNL
jgi:2-haloacid dehalogenase